MLGHQVHILGQRPGNVWKLLCPLDRIRYVTYVRTYMYISWPVFSHLLSLYKKRQQSLCRYVYVSLFLLHQTDGQHRWGQSEYIYYMYICSWHAEYMYTTVKAQSNFSQLVVPHSLEDITIGCQYARKA